MKKTNLIAGVMSIKETDLSVRCDAPSKQYQLSVKKEASALFVSEIPGCPAPNALDIIENSVKGEML